MTNGIMHASDSVFLPSFDIVETAIINGNFTAFISALRAVNLFNTLRSTNPLTVFAPTDIAFDQLAVGVVTVLLKVESRDSIRRILQYRVLSGNVPSASINTMTLPTNITMPTDDRVTLTMNEGMIRVNNATVRRTDVFATNGVIHTIDTVLLPLLNIVGTAVRIGYFRTLISALRTADVVNALESMGPCTVFAPSDAAFNKLSENILADLLKPQNLINLLRSHILSRRLTTADINNMSLPADVNTLVGGSIRLTRIGATIRANVVMTDILSTNGFFHMIDSVLMPAQTTASASLIHLHARLIDTMVLISLFRLLPHFRIGLVFSSFS